MALIDLASRKIYGKIVYFGPGLGGKTTNLREIHARLPISARSDLVSIDSEGERTVFFDFLPLDLGTVHGFSIRFQLYTVPGQPHYERTRAAVLGGADGVVFVADSRVTAQPENRQSLGELGRALARQGKSIDTFPLVIQYNKADVLDAATMPDLESNLNPTGRISMSAVAIQGIGVFETLKAICKLVVQQL